jgi:hypothetical protein
MNSEKVGLNGAVYLKNQDFVDFLKLATNPENGKTLCATSARTGPVPWPPATALRPRTGARIGRWARSSL